MRCNAIRNLQSHDPEYNNSISSTLLIRTLTSRLKMALQLVCINMRTTPPLLHRCGGI